MARLERHRLIPECPDEPALLHITNRGADQRPIFHSPADRLVFLSILAHAFLDDGLRVHCFCLMTNHFHLLVEDPKGMISRAMLRLQGSYARYFNDIRGKRGAGHLFGDRFFSEQVTSARFYDRLISYTLLNPLHCATPLAATAEAYPWSSAALHLETVSPAAYFSMLVERLGGLEAILASMPKPTRPEFDRARRARFDALLTGEWIVPEAARCGRTPEQMRHVLEQRRSQPLLNPDPLEDNESAHQLKSRSEPSVPRNEESGLIGAFQVPRVTDRFRGLPVESVVESILRVCRSTIPDQPASADVICYALWRFTSALPQTLAMHLGTTAEAIERAVERLRNLRGKSLPWEPLLRRLEWRIRFVLRCAPWRA